MGLVHFSLHRPRPIWARWDTLPFLLLQAVNMAIIMAGCFSSTPDATVESRKDSVPWWIPCRPPLLCALAIPVLLGVQVIVHLGTFWSVDFKTFVTMIRVSDISAATCVKVHPRKATEKPGICALEWISLKDRDGFAAQVASFEFHKRRFLWDAGEKRFVKVAFPVDHTMDAYLRARGLGAGDVADATARWGVNSFEIPLPTFGDLYKEQCRQPFFVFQMFCVLLWSMDDYWYYSLFTLGMLLLFEATVVLSRTRNIRMLREMMGRPTAVKVFREGAWTTLPSNQLLPGDVISVTRARNDPDAVVPADLLLLNGAVVVNEAILTGESAPQQKTSVAHRAGGDVLGLRRHADTGDRGHVVFGGTRVLQATADPESLPKGLPRPPDGGCAAFVLRNGFQTAQGRLVRTILFASEHATANTRDAAIFVACLLAFALAAAGYVLARGLADERRSRGKLLLNCSFIIASVVPPELPMNLSLAVNSSLQSLARLGVFCTEPFRIPFAGKVGICCFDKTGTLTSEDLVLRGVAPLPPPDAAAAAAATDRSPPTAKSSSKAAATGAAAAGTTADGAAAGGTAGGLVGVRECGDETGLILAGCHGLAFIDDIPTGEAMERVGMDAAGWALARGDAATERAGRRRKMQVLHRFPFASSLARMATIVEISDGPGGGGRRTLVLAKGAPEAIGPRLAGGPPPGYEATYRRFAREGARVIALAWRALPAPGAVSKLRGMPREEAEAGLTFAGFAVFHCPSKPESAPSLKALKASGHRLVMITGDQVLTACHVARELGMCTRAATLILEPLAGGSGGEYGSGEGAGAGLGEEGKMVWRSTDETISLPADLNPAAVAALAKQYDLCVPGAALRLLQAAAAGPAAAAAVVEQVRVFARTSPAQKEAVLVWLKARGHHTLMCGDGTNDVGALKAAHAGVALLQTPGAPTTPEPPLGGGPGAGQPTLQELARRLEREMASEEPSLVRLGDASMASPFTCRQSSVYPVTRIIQQGRCTLVTTMQIYKIQALTCLSLAYCLSALYLDGVKLGDQQMMASGLLSAALFLFMSHARPLVTLAPRRPPATIVCFYMAFTVFAQFAIHMASLLAAIHLAAPHTRPGWVCGPDSVNGTAARDAGEPAPSCPGPCAVPEGAEAGAGCGGCVGGPCISDRDPDAGFSPSVLNSAVFLATSAAQLSTFAVNYKGRPYMASLAENRPLLYALVVGFTTLAAAALEVVPGLNTWLQLAPLPGPTLRLGLVVIMLTDLIASAVAEGLASLVLYPAACRDATDRLLR